MMKWLLSATFIVGLTTAGYAATTNMMISITGPPATSISCPVNYPAGQTGFPAPVAPGTLMATCTVSPTGWSGSLSIGGPDASYFALSSATVSTVSVTVGAAAITQPRVYSITVTASP